MESRKEIKGNDYTELALRLEAIINTATDGIIIIDERGLIEMMNPAAERLFGYQHGELHGCNVSALMPEPHREQHDEYISQYLRTGKAKIIGIGREVEGRRNNGEIFPFRLSISEVKLGERRIFTGIVHDLSEQKASENALREEKERARMYFDLANTINVVLDVEGRILALNNKGERFICQPEAEAIGRNWFDLILPEEERALVKSAFADIMTGNIPLVPYHENELCDPEGERHYFAWHNNFIRDHDGRIAGMIASGADISERRHAEKALEREKERAQQYLDVANTIIVVINRDECIRLLNRKGCELLGYTEQEAIGENWFDLAIPRKQHATVKAFFHRMMKGHTPVDSYFENEVLIRSGERRLIAWHNAAVKNDAGEIVATISSGLDITEQRAAEERIRQLNAELESRVEMRTEELAEAVNQLLNINKQLEYEIQERKAVESALRKSEQELRKAYEKEKELNELKSRFVSMASHEFRTPLSAILSSADIIEAYTTTEHQAKRERHTGRIKSAVSNLTGILNDFLSLSRLEEGKIQPQPTLFVINTFCRALIEELNGLLKPGQQIHFHGSEDETFVSIDRAFLRNILINLFSNAIKYSPPGKPIQFHLRVENGWLSFSIADEGIGIPEEEQQHLFTRFFRAHNVENIQGTGLGLNIVRRYVDLMGGTIRFESQLGRGATFYVDIPCSDRSIPTG
jgi:two-component system sensor kinase FixL